MAALRVHSMSGIKMLIEALSVVARILSSVKRRNCTRIGGRGCYGGV